MTREELDAICSALREQYAEFRAPLTWHGVQRVLRRSGVRYLRVPLDEPAMLLTHAGVSVIVLNSDLPPRSHTEAMAHEFAHIRLHAGDPVELRFHVWRPDVQDPRELEADYLCRCLMVGPGVDVPFETAAPVRRAPARPAARPFVAPFADPYAHEVRAADRSPHRREPHYGGRFAETALQRAMRLARPLARSLSAGPVSDAGSIVHETDGKVRFVDADGMRWTVWDIAFLPERTVITPGRAVAKYRYFVNANGAQRFYQFTKWELRDVAPQHCERQLRDATQVPVRRAATRGKAAG